MKRSVRIIIAGTSLIVLLAFSVEDPFFRKLQDKLTAFYEQNRPAKVYCSFNQPSYAPGDTAFFSMSFFDAVNHAPISGRQIINVHLLDAQGSILVRQKSIVTDGSGANQIVLPYSTTPGVYTFVAFSEWMKNQDSTLFFYKPIAVHGIKQLTLKPTETLQFFPEGGSLIAGVLNKVVVTGSRDALVSVKNDAGSEVARCGLNEFGLGVFYLNPEKNARYTANTHALPLPKSTGVAFITTRGSDDNLKLSLMANIEASDNFYVTVSQESDLYFTSRVTLSPARPAAVVEIPASNVREGVSLITLFGENGDALQSRLFFAQPSTTSRIEVTAPATTATREKVTVKFKAVDENGRPLASRISVSVFSGSLLKYDTADNIARTLSLKSDLMFNAAHVPAFNAMDNAALDDFLVTQQWKRFDWHAIQQDLLTPKFSFKKNVYLTGKVIPTNSNVIIPDSSVITFFLQRHVMTYQSYVRADGNFDFPLFYDFFNDDYVYYRIEKDGKPIDGLKIESQPAGTYQLDFPKYREIDLNHAYGILQNKKKVIDAAYGYSKGAAMYTKNAVQPHALLEEEIFGADHEIKLEDYLLFPTMEEVVREIIPMVQHRKVGGKSVVKVYIDDLEALAAEQPIYMIDGVMTDDTDYFMNLKPDNVKVIKVVNSVAKLHTFGTIGKYGMILVETKIPNNTVNVPRSSHSFLATGINEAKFFEPVKFDVHAQHAPNLKTCLYWNANVVTDKLGNAEITFYTSDATGDFRIVAEGLGAQGQAVTGAKTFKVTYTH
jgi:hypothetical protein